MVKGVSAEKAHRGSLRKREVNRQRERSVRTSIKTARDAIAADPAAAETTVKSALVALDRAASRGALHPNNAARRKSRLAKRENKAKAAAQGST